MEVATDEEAHKPFHKIQQKEPNEEEFLLLCSMYPLMPQPCVIKLHFGEDDTKEVDGSVSAKRYYVILDYEHLSASIRWIAKLQYFY